MTTKERIIKYLKYKNISKREFYAKTGLSNGFLDSGKHLGTENLATIITHYPDLNIKWIVLDEGDMLNNETTTSQKQVTKKHHLPPTKAHSCDEETMKLLIDEKDKLLESKDKLIEINNKLIEEKDKLLAEKERVITLAFKQLNMKL